MRKMMEQNIPYCLIEIEISIFLSLCKGKKSQKDFLIKNETDSSNLLVVKIIA